MKPDPNSGRHSGRVRCLPLRSRNWPLPFSNLSENTALPNVKFASKENDLPERKHDKCVIAISGNFLSNSSMMSVHGSDTSPQFNKSEAEAFFRETYSSGPRNFVHPEWLPKPSLPECEFNCENISLEEVRRAIQRTKSSSTPSPLDQISYNILKRCPSLHTALLNIYTACWEESTVPPA